MNQSDRNKREKAAAVALHQHFAYSNKPNNPASQAWRIARVALMAADQAVPVEVKK